MALTSRETKISVKRFFTGLETFKVVAFNPNAAQLKSIYNTEDIQEPEYTSENRARFSFILDNENEQNRIKTRVDYYLTNEGKSSSTGKIQVCNAYGQFTWLEDPSVVPDNMSWFKSEGVRPSYKGEEELIKFLWARLNIRTDLGDTIQLDNVGKYFSGDFSDIRNVLNQNIENKVMFCLGVKRVEGDTNNFKYNQIVYGKHTMKPSNNSKTINSLHKSLSEYKSSNTYFGLFPYDLTEVNPATINFSVAVDSPEVLDEKLPF